MEEQTQGATGCSTLPGRDTVGQPSDEPLPRPQRQRRPDKADRGLPPDQELFRLAIEYLGRQRKNWPELVKVGALPDVDDPVIVASMVDDFKHRHRTGQVDLTQVQVFLKHCKKLGGDYNRYSCDNSSPTSIIDQMVNGLDKGRDEGRFIPWAYVFCDYSVSGLNSSRQGYSSYKKVLQETAHGIETTYIDEFTRASRDEIEWWKLASLSKRLKKRMIGASDGFDLSAPDWDVKITIYGLISRLFIKGLREKVKRGMRGAARRGTCLGKLPLGFTRKAKRDEHGNMVCDQDGLPLYVPCIDPVTCDSRKLLYELFVDKGWSPYQIAKHFNTLKIDGWEGWTEGGIKKLLKSPSAIGIFIWNKTRREFDWDEEKLVVVENPRKDWEVYHDRNLEIVSMDKWKAARKKLSAMRRNSPLTGRKLSRNQKSATTLFSGTLVCGYCGQDHGGEELKLMRSGKYKVMGCLNGPTGKHGCKLTTSKSTRIIEQSLLGYLQERLFTEEVIEDLVVRANAFLADEASKPRVATNPLKASIRDKEAKIKKLFTRIESSDDETLVQAYEKHISEFQKEVNLLKSELQKADVQNKPTPPPLDLARVKALLPDLRDLLNQDIPVAAEVIRGLTGLISIRQEIIPGKRGGRWIATFTPNLLALLRRVSKGKECPDSITLEYLGSRIWITPETVEVSIDAKPKHATIAEKVKALRDKGNSINTIAALLGATWETVKAAIVSQGASGKPTRKHSTPTCRKSHSTRKSIDVAEVVRLRDEKLLSFKRIARILSVSAGTVARAYDRGHPELVSQALEQGRRPSRGRYSHLAPRVFAQIRAGLQVRKPPTLIATEVGCGTSTVYRVLRRMRDEELE